MMSKTIDDPFIYRPDRPLVVREGGPLSGIKLAVKDLFHVAGWPTGAGNPDWLHSHPVPEQTNSTVKHLLSLGAELTGKTHTDELAYSLNGQNIHYGTLNNPKAPGRLPGGSSSGSAVAVAAGLADIGLGTDTGGSIRVPAAYNGIYGLRPTHNAVSMDHMVPLAPSFDTTGWLINDLELCRTLTGYLIPDAPLTPADRPLAVINESRDLCSVWPQTQNWLEQQDIRFETVSLGIEPVLYGDAFRVLQGYEIWQTHGNWLLSQQPVLAADIQERLNWCAGLTSEDRNRALKIQESLKTTLKSLLEDHLLLLPTTPAAAPLLSTSSVYLKDYRHQLICLTAIAGLCGLPQLHLPWTAVDGAPTGFSLLGGQYEEHLLCNWAQRLLESQQ